MKKVIFFVLILLTNSVFAQYIQNVGMIDGATGNLVYTDVNRPPPGADPYSWSGFMSTTSNGGGYSGGYMPGWNGSTGTFMFGYNQGTIAYSTPVNYALAMAGTNIQVNGFKYSWEYLNQDFSRGTLSANINLTNTSGQVLQNYNYNMPKTTSGWTLYSGTENFNTQYPGSYIGNLNVSFTGKDDRWWAGYYGPQVRNIDVSLLYSVAPPPVTTDFSKWIKLTDENGNFTLTTESVVRYGAQGTYVYANFKPGTYSCTNSAWGIDPLGGVGKECDVGSNTTTTTTTTTATLPKTTTTTTDYTTTVPLLDPVTTTASPTTATTGTIQTVDSTPTTTASVTASPTIVSAPSPVTTTTTATTATASSATSSTSSTQSSTKDSSGSSSGNVGLALSIINKNSERDAAGSAVAQSAVAQANQAATQAQQDAATVASNAVSNSTSSTGSIMSGSPGSGTGIKVASVNSSSTLSSVSTINVGNVTFGGMTGSNMPGLNSQITQTPTGNPATQTITVSNFTTATATVSSQVTESLISQPQNTLTDKSSPLNDAFEQKQIVPQTTTTSFSGPAVNKNAGDSEIAGGVKIDKMATAPTGYGDYLNFTMRDVAFYQPKEVYRNQRNVDNQRALRQMTSDSKHRQMVEMQYAK